MAEIEDILRVREEPVPAKERAELPDLVPEDGAEPVLDVEIVAFDEGEDGARKLEAFVEGLPSTSASAVTGARR